MTASPRHPRPRHPRGSALALIVLLSVILTGLVLTIAWAAGTQAQSASRFIVHDQTFYAAEAGACRVGWYIRNNRLGTLTQPYTGTLGPCAYSVTWTSAGAAKWKITSTATNGPVASTVSVLCSPPMAVPNIASGGDLQLKNLIVTGNLGIAGDLSGTGAVTGSIVYGGTNYAAATSTSAPTITATAGIAKGTVALPDMAVIGRALTTNAGITLSGDQTSPTFDFTVNGGSKRVIKVIGNVTDPIFIGAGTLYVTGTIHFTKPNATTGTAASPVDLVAAGDILFDKSSTVYGALYTAGTWYRAQTEVDGAVYFAVSVDQSNLGLSTIAAANTPWFDNRTGGGSGSGLSFTNFTGPMP